MLNSCSLWFFFALFKCDDLVSSSVRKSFKFELTAGCQRAAAWKISNSNWQQGVKEQNETVTSGSHSKGGSDFHLKTDPTFAVLPSAAGPPLGWFHPLWTASEQIWVGLFFLSFAKGGGGRSYAGWTPSPTPMFIPPSGVDFILDTTVGTLVRDHCKIICTNALSHWHSDLDFVQLSAWIQRSR